MIAVVDYGMGNLRSVARALAAAGGDVTVTSDPALVARAARVVLPGVGAFADAMAELRQRGLVEPLRAVLAEGRPLLGICLGLQLLFEVGEEFGEHSGLGVLPGRVVRFADPTLKVPHLGWNRVTPTRPHPVLAEVPAGAHFYFVHSFHAVPVDAADVAATTEYGLPFASCVARGSAFACQFHPEKSQVVGLSLLRGFLRWRP